MISRQDAKAQGLKRYFTGVACANGHVAERRVSDGKCCGCDISKKSRQRRARGAPIRMVLGRDVGARRSAAEAGQTRYFTGIPCPKGHVAERMTNGGHCVECLRLKTTLPVRRVQKHKNKVRRKAQRRDVNHAAALLTETLGVPHVVVETVDPKTGRKDWQPKPAS